LTSTPPILAVLRRAFYEETAGRGGFTGLENASLATWRKFFEKIGRFFDVFLAFRVPSC